MNIYRKSLLSFLVLFQTILSLNAQLSIEFSKTFGANANDFYTGIGSAEEDEIFLIGYSSSNYGIFNQNEGNYDVVLHKLNQSGELLSNINDGSQWMDVSENAVNINSHLYVSTYSITDRGVESRLKVFDLDQNKTNEFILNEDGDEYPRRMVASNSGDLLICGNSKGALNRFGGGDVFLKKVSKDGIVIWSKSYGGKLFDSVNSVFELKNGNIMLAGFTYSNDGLVDRAFGKKDAWTMMLDANGEKLWSKNLGTEQFEAIVDLVEIPDGILLVGNKGLFDLSDPLRDGIYHDDIWLVKLNNQGELQWEKNYGGKGNEKVCAMIPTNDGLLITATTDSKDGIAAGNQGKSDALILNIDLEGNIKSQLLLGGEGIDELSKAYQDRKGHLWLVGFTDSNYGDISESFGNKDGWIVKLKGTPPSFSLNLGQDRYICEGESVNINATISNCDCDYTWSDGSKDPIRELSLSNDTELSLLVTDALGNQASDEIKIFVNPLPDASLIVDEMTCSEANDANINLNIISGQGPFLINWNNGVQEEDLFNLNEGTYEVTLTDANTCTNIFSTTIQSPAPLTLEAELTQLSCTGQDEGSISLSVSGGLAPYEYEWSTGSTEPVLDNLPSGIYEVTLTDAKACKVEQAFVLNAISGISIELDVTKVSCFGGSDGQIQVSVEGGTGEYELNWNNGATSSRLENLEAGFYILSLTDSNGCEAITQVQVHEPDEIVISFEAETEKCNDSGDGFISVIAEGGIGDLKYLWNNSLTSPEISALNAGTYIVEVSDENECKATQEIILEEVEAISINTEKEEVKCFQAADGSLKISVEGNQGELDVNWNNGLEGLNPQNIAAGTYSLTLTDENNCTLEETFVFEEAEELNIDFETTDLTCFESEDGKAEITNLNGNGPFEIEWSNGDVGMETMALSAGITTLTVSDANNCLQTFGIEILQPSAIEPIVEVFDILCFNDETGSALASANGGTAPYKFAFFDGENTALNESANLEMVPAGTYTLLVTDDNDCQEEIVFEINENERINPFFEIKDATCPNEDDGALSLLLDGSENYEFLWSTGSIESRVENLGEGTYTLSITDAFECETVYQFFLDQPEPFELIYGLQDESCFEEQDGEIAISFNGGTEPYNFLWSNGDSSTFLMDLVPGEYELSILDAEQCTFDTNFVVSSAEEIIISEELNASDKGEDNGSIEINITGGMLPYRVMWNTGYEGTSLSELAPGIYSFTLTDGNACEVTGSYEVDEIGPSSINGQALESIYEVYPNPSSDEIFIRMPERFKEVTTSIFDLNGRNLGDMDHVPNNGIISLRLKHLTSGVYFVEINNSNTTSRVKIILQK